MVIKWILCRVPEEKRAAFDLSQRSWERLAGCRGFQGQVGGWVEEQPTSTESAPDTHEAEACIVAFWRDLESYHAFMGQVHDQVLEAAGQRALYTSTHVHLLQPRLPLEGSHHELHEAVPLARWLRLLSSQSAVGDLDALLERQRQIWAPGLPVLQGLLAGCFATGLSHESALAATFWQDRQSVDLYQQHIYPRLLRRAGAPPFPGESRLRLVRIEDGWRVPSISNN
ncbi:MAG: DUF4937 domain-containing protein [Calditrichaeota bacterium]|nr:DUF4937 domain-containing protein [Candidatus Cloacimonadota bacterium]MCA9787665.1 DUF4937 domain-containing protein [Candidatus Cloacimonadota bacterium]MCB1045962.1 DUF4937 domain-containing protein [Calditrichota bacterium]MCB9473204.1 DUF4937 domain-containing protein [Candidatus Delongbacteria bacterium]